MTGAGGVLALVLVEWATGLAAIAAWTQSWSVVSRGHFRILAWTTLVFALLGFFAVRTVGPAAAAGGLVAASLLYLVLQYARSDAPGAVAGALAAAAGIVTLILLAGRIDGFSDLVAVVHLIAGAALLGGVTNGMLLGHWYLNQPGLKPWALGRITDQTLVGAGAAAVAGLLTAGALLDAATEGAVLGLQGFGESFGPIFFAAWILLVGFTGVVVWMARRCIQIRSIQSATGLYYVALLTAGVAEFVVRYLMVNVS